MHPHAEHGNNQQHREQARSHIKQTGAQLTRRPAGRPVCSTLARPDRSHAPRGNAAGDALRSAVDTRLESCARVTRSVTGCIPTRSVGTIKADRRSAFAPHHASGRALARLSLLILICRVGRPNAGSAQWATRHGCRVSRPRPWMADGGVPTEQDRSEGMPSLGEAPDVRGASAWLLGVGPRRLLQVTRRQGGTNSRHDRRNGYAPNWQGAADDQSANQPFSQ